MRAAQLLIVNHALLLSDLALRNPSRPREASAGTVELLGSYDLLVLDEAHTLENAASDHFGVTISSTSVAMLLRDLYNARTNRGLLSLWGDEAAIAAVRQAGRA